MEDDDRAKGILVRIPAGRWGVPEDFKVRIDGDYPLHSGAKGWSRTHHSGSVCYYLLPLCICI